MVVFCFSPPRCVPTCVVFLNFPHNASHLPTSFLYEETRPSQFGVCFFAFNTTTTLSTPRVPRSQEYENRCTNMKRLHNANVLNPMSDTPIPTLGHI